MPGSFDPYHRWLGISPKDQPPSHYRLLGVDLFESDLNVIESAADRQMAHVRTFQAGKHSDQSQRILNELAAAKLTLLSPEKKNAYDQALKDEIAAKAPELKPLPKVRAIPVAADEALKIASPEPRGSALGHVEIRQSAANEGTRRRVRSIWQRPVVLGGVVTGAIVLIWLGSLFNPGGGSTVGSRDNDLPITVAVDPPEIPPPSRETPEPPEPPAEDFTQSSQTPGGHLAATEPNADRTGGANADAAEQNKGSAASTDPDTADQDANPPAFADNGVVAQDANVAEEDNENDPTSPEPQAPPPEPGTEVAPLPDGSFPGLIGFVSLRDKGMTELVLQYQPGTSICDETLKPLFDEHGVTGTRIEVILKGELELPKTTTIIVRQNGGSGGEGPRRLLINNLLVASVDPDGATEYRQKLNAGRHPVTWVFSGTKFGEGNRIEILDADTNQPLSVAYRQRIPEGSKPLAVGSQ